MLAPVISCTRLWSKEPDGNLSVDRIAVLLRWLRTALTYSEAVAVAIDTTTSFKLLNAVKAIIATHLQEGEKVRVHLVPVAPYGFYVPALMALLHYAKNLGYERICYQSQEVHCTRRQFMAVWDVFNAETDLVVGPELQGHAFRRVEDIREGKEGQRDETTTYNVNGVTVPWDTFAIWSVAKLSRVGMLPLAEAHIESGGAIEEVTAIVMQHRLFGEAEQGVKLVRLTGNPIGWDHITGVHVDEARRAANLMKIQTKRQRSLAQLHTLNLLKSIESFSYVRHVQVECPREQGEEDSTH